ncbi:hypothetical protein COS75_00960 [Candidatus Pacearchaeota archaeon CG06_land_8_20_14_3_00_35_12]|nr:MAG: hypothetical protein COS75_00960 [Candidatus Pacearchaeota archaeon CG06_land_8_20_14_3_00_35_12]
MITYNPIPVLLEIGNFKIYSWGTMLAISFIIALFFMLKDAKKKKIESRHIWNMWLLCLMGAIIGSRLLYVLLNFTYYYSKPIEIFQLWAGGLASFGGILLSLLFVFIYAKKTKIDFEEIIDSLAPYLALGFAITRIGCFLNWDDFGIASSLPWAISAAGDIPRHPTQLYLSALDFLLFILLIKIRKIKENLKNKRINARIVRLPLLAVFFFCFAIIRLLVGPIRVYDTANYNLFSISISLLLLMASSLWVVKKIKKFKKV